MKKLIAFFSIVTLASFFLVNIFFTCTAQANIISTKQEIAIGKDAAKYVEKQYKPVQDPELQARINKIGQNLVAVSARKDIPYSFRVLQSDEVNAFALPGGFIYIFSGLVNKMQTDDEIAGILGHEIAHVVKRHSINQMESNIGLSILSTIFLAKTDNGMAAASAVLSAVFAGYSRSDEAQADKIGYEEALAAGYNPYGMLVTLMKLNDLAPAQKTDLFSDHPDTLNRITKMKGYLNTLHIPVKLTIKNDLYTLTAGNYHSIPLRVSVDGLSALERTYFLAGNIYKITQRNPYNANYYVLDSDGVNISIYYDDIYILKLTPADAAANNTDLQSLADDYVNSLKQIMPTASNGIN